MDHCPKHCYLLLMMTSVQMLLTLADQLGPSETGVRRKPVRKQIAKFNELDGGKHQDTLISASFACFRKSKGFHPGSCFLLRISSAVAKHNGILLITKVMGECHFIRCF